MGAKQEGEDASGTRVATSQKDDDTQGQSGTITPQIEVPDSMEAKQAEVQVSLVPPVTPPEESAPQGVANGLGNITLEEAAPRDEDAAQDTSVAKEPEDEEVQTGQNRFLKYEAVATYPWNRDKAHHPNDVEGSDENIKEGINNIKEDEVR